MLDDLDVLRVLLASLLFAAATAGLGRMVRPPEGLGPADLAVGLGVLGIGTLILSRLGLGLETSVSVLLLPGFLLFLLGMRHWRAAQFSLRVSALHAPLVILSAAIPLIAWDDFSHWLRNALFLQQWDSFPGPGLPPPDSQHGTYPPGTALITFAVAVIGRSFFGLEAVPETAAPVLTVILFGTLAASLGPWLRDRTPSAWLGAAIALLCVVWANPGFIPRVVFTNYGDASTAALLGIALTVFLFHWQRKSLPGLLQLGFILAAIVNTKQTGLVIVAIFVCATIAGLVLLSGWPRRSFTGTGSGTHASAQGEPGPPVALSRGGYLLAFCAVLLPAILMWLLWRHHAEAATGGFNIRPLAQWSWALAPQTLASMGQVLFSKIAFTSASLLAIFLALRAWRSGSSASLGQAATIFSLALLAWVAALFVFYMGGSFNEFEVAAAASFWRYISQFAGALGVVLALALVSSAWLRSGAACLVARAPQGLRRGLVTFPAVLVFILPALAFGELWPRSREPAPPLRRAAEQLRPMLPQGGTVLVVDPQGNGMSHVALAFAWRDWLRVIWAPEFYRRESLTAEQLLDRAAATQADVVFLVSTDREVERAFGTGAIQGHGWRVLRRTETGWLPLAEGRWR